MKFRIWHIPQVPMKAFHVEVSNIETAKVLLKALADYDLFQLEHNIKPDFCNVSGCEFFNEEDQEWEEWNSDDDEEIWDIIRSEKLLTNLNE